MKRCTKCGVEKPVGDFYVDRGKPRANCKVCHRARITERIKAAPEKHKAYRAEYHKRHSERLGEKYRQYREARGDEYNANRRRRRADDPEKYRATQRAWRDANLERAQEIQRRSYDRRKEEIQAKAREDRKQNPEKHRQYERTKRERHADKIRARQLRYYQENPEVFEKHRRKREARKADVDWQPYTRREIWERDGGTCRECDKPLPFGPGEFQIDHIVPISLGGPDTPANVQLMCPSCNRRKWANLEGQIHLPV